MKPPIQSDMRGMLVREYLDLLKVPDVLRLTSAQLFARLPLGMLSLAILLHVEAVTDSYAIAGMVVACVSVGEAVAMPLMSRIAGVIGARTTLMVTALVNAAAMIVLVLLPPVVPLLIGFGFVIGCSVPPLMPVVRSLYPRLVEGPSVRVLFALDTTAQEMIWILGPVLATLLASSVTTLAPLLLSAILTVVGTAWFVASPRLRMLALPRNRLPFGRVLANRAVLLAMAASFFLVASFSALQIGVVVAMPDDGVLAGIGLAVSGLGSFISGITLGHRPWKLRGLVLSLATVAFGTALTGLVPGLLLQFSALFISGFGFAPALSTLYLMVSREVTDAASTEAYGWMNTGSLVGGAIGTAIGGFASDASGAGGAYAIATLFAVVAVLSPLFARFGGPLPGLSHSVA